MTKRQPFNRAAFLASYPYDTGMVSGYNPANEMPPRVASTGGVSHNGVSVMATPDDTHIPDGFKRCRTCQAVKPLDEFGAAKNSKDGHRGECKQCRSAYFRKLDAGRSEYKKELRRRASPEQRDNQLARRQRYAPRARELKRALYAKNPEHYRAQKREHTRAQRESDPEAYYAKRANAHREWRAKNIDHVRQYDREDYRRNIDKHRERGKQYHAAHPEQAKAKNVRRRARAQGAKGSFVAADIEAVRTAQGNRCYLCGKPLKRGYHVDHFIPLALGGTNDPGNLRLACPKCNLSKGAKHPHELGILL